MLASTRCVKRLSAPGPRRNSSIPQRRRASLLVLPIEVHDLRPRVCREAGRAEKDDRALRPSRSLSGASRARYTRGPSPVTEDDRREAPRVTPPLTDPAEAVERIVPRRQLLVEDGDILIMREAGGLREGSRVIYELRIRGKGPTEHRFASFELAAATGEELATRTKVRLFYFESKEEPPHLLLDARGT